MVIKWTKQFKEEDDKVQHLERIRVNWKWHEIRIRKNELKQINFKSKLKNKMIKADEA